jgi:hypothetical protein
MATANIATEISSSRLVPIRLATTSALTPASKVPIASADACRPASNAVSRRSSLRYGVALPRP